jgi:hypothetical protein
MGIFSSIMNKIFHHKGGQAQAAPVPAATSTPAAPAATTITSAPMTAVEVEAVLTIMANDKGGGGNWRSSIMDLLKLLDLDSDIGARKELAQELGVHAGEHGSAEQNIALHNTVMRKLAENGGVVPDNLGD